MNNNRLQLFESLKKLYGKNLFDLDRQSDIKKLKTEGWIFENNTGQELSKPDFLIANFNKRNVLIELKVIEETTEDEKLKEEFIKLYKGEKRSLVYYPELNRSTFKYHIEKANSQLKEFINSNNTKLETPQLDLSTTVVFYSNRFMLDYSIPDIQKILYGQVVETVEQTIQVHFRIADKILNINRYRSIGLVAIWNGKDKFKIYNNPWTILKNNNPLFLSGADLNYFVIEDLFSQITGTRFSIFLITDYSGDSKVEFLIDREIVEMKDINETLLKQVLKNHKLINEHKNLVLEDY